MEVVSVVMVLVASPAVWQVTMMVALVGALKGGRVRREKQGDARGEKFNFCVPL